MSMRSCCGRRVFLVLIHLPVVQTTFCIISLLLFVCWARAPWFESHSDHLCSKLMATVTKSAVESGSKNYHGRFHEKGQPNEVGHACNTQSNYDTLDVQCRFYRSIVTPLGLQHSTCSLCRSSLLNLPNQICQLGWILLKIIMAKVSELPVKYTNHTIWATSAFRMLQSGVPKRL